MLDYLVVGQGLAGTLISYQLYLRNLSFLVVDEENASSSSIIAAGIIDPITSRRNGKVWMIDEVLPEADQQYKALENLLSIEFFNKISLIKPFANQEEANSFIIIDEIRDFIQSRLPQDPSIGTPYGGLKVEGALLHSAKLVLAWRSFLKGEKHFWNEKFDCAQLKIFNEHVEYKGESAKQVIFCEGYKAALENPYFSYLPFWLAKGEILDIETQIALSEGIFYKSIFVMPVGGNNYRIGPTFERNVLDEIPSEEGKREILSKFEKIFEAPVRVIAHKAAIRPTVKDRRPMLGRHPKYRNLSVFNGLGTKGVMLAPYFSKHFLDHLEHQTPLSREVDIRRFEQKP